MDYEKAARELLGIRAKLAQDPLQQMLDAFVRGEYFVLNYLERHGGTAYPKDLSRGMSVSSARVAALLNQLEKKGLIVRSSDCSDSRQTRILLTREGEMEIRQKQRAVVKGTAGVLEKLGPEDTRELLRIRQRMLEL